MNIKNRLLTSEQLDNLSLSGKVLEDTLHSLRLINQLLGNHKQLSTSLIKYCIHNHTKKELHIVDLGCGGGDCMYYISERLKKHGIKVTLIGIDGNPKSISYANERYFGHTNLKFIAADILAKDFTIPHCDILISSHFMYHFNDQNLTKFLKKVQYSSIRYIIFSELYRSKIAYLLFKLLGFLLPISKIAKKDGLIAIQRAFSIKELKKIIQESGIKKYEVIKKPFFRSITKIDLQK